MSAPHRLRAPVPERTAQKGAALCPRCGGAFECGADGAARCACADLVLPAATLQALRGQYSGCLCLRCLHELAGTHALEGHAPPRQAAQG